MKKDQIEQFGKQIISSAYYVHKEMGPGLLESIYQSCLLEELLFRGIHVEKEVFIPLFYRNKPVQKDHP
jgi:GxxExxY protein